ncbi:MAG: PTS sugar transporter subunit IIA [Spirochaetaceae bacterium]|jgi:PTS system fructose-specific IIC component/PTS system nitrogen regulatory IIA component|nr:PTS sugar transporter subunit IIA [Spirochaetaceae bacterium]
MILGEVFSPRTITVSLKGETRDEVFEELIDLLAGAYPEISRADALRAVKEREAKMSTGIKKGIAVPHGKSADVKGVVGAVGISRRGIDYDALDSSPVNLVFLLLTDPKECEYHLQVLNTLSNLLDTGAFLSGLTDLKTPQDVYSRICKFESLLASEA